MLSSFFGFFGGANRAAKPVWLVLLLLPVKTAAPSVPSPTPLIEPVL